MVAARRGRRGELPAASPGGGEQVRRGARAAAKEVVKQSISPANCELGEGFESAGNTPAKQ